MIVKKNIYIFLQMVLLFSVLVDDGLIAVLPLCMWLMVAYGHQGTQAPFDVARRGRARREKKYVRVGWTYCPYHNHSIDLIDITQRIYI